MADRRLQPARPARALAAYRKRWAIECMFGDAKTRGLNLEDTRLTCPRKLDLLMALVALALAWAGRTAADLLGNREPQGNPTDTSPTPGSASASTTSETCSGPIPEPQPTHGPTSPRTPRKTAESCSVDRLVDKNGSIIDHNRLTGVARVRLRLTEVHRAAAFGMI